MSHPTMWRAPLGPTNLNLGGAEMRRSVSTSAEIGRSRARCVSFRQSEHASSITGGSEPYPDVNPHDYLDRQVDITGRSTNQGRDLTELAANYYIAADELSGGPFQWGSVEHINLALSMAMSDEAGEEGS